MPTPRSRSPEEEPDLLSASPEEQLAQQQKLLADLKRKQTELEERKKHLEDLNARRKEIAEGQRWLREKFTRGLALLERAEHEARREVEQIQISRQSFDENLKEIESIDPSSWDEETLNRSLSKIDHARAIYAQFRARIDALSGRDLSGESASDEETDGVAEGDPLGSPSFFELVRRGFAFTLPLLILLVILIALLAAR
ncbi:MAG: hypothetical protein OHK005_01480 [Candidatus Methylacidiphilales bacterium]